MRRHYFSFSAPLDMMKAMLALFSGAGMRIVGSSGGGGGMNRADRAKSGALTGAKPEMAVARESERRARVVCSSTAVTLSSYLVAERSSISKLGSGNLD